MNHFVLRTPYRGACVLSREAAYEALRKLVSSTLFCGGEAAHSRADVNVATAKTLNEIERGKPFSFRGYTLETVEDDAAEETLDSDGSLLEVAPLSLVNTPVKHPWFGKGRIVSYHWNRREITVRFDGEDGQKAFLFTDEQFGRLLRVDTPV